MRQAANRQAYQAGFNPMAEYICRIGTPTGEVVTRTIEATAERDLRSKLEREGFRVFSIVATGSAGVRRAIGAESRGRKIKTEDFLLFNQQLSALLRAGLPILQAIGILRKRVPNEQLRIVLEEVEEKVRGGHALSQASLRRRFIPANLVARSLRRAVRLAR